MLLKCISFTDINKGYMNIPHINSMNQMPFNI